MCIPDSRSSCSDFFCGSLKTSYASPTSLNFSLAASTLVGFLSMDAKIVVKSNNNNEKKHKRDVNNYLKK